MALILFVFIFIGLVISVIISVFFLLNLQQLLKEVQLHNRLVPHNNVWLMFIPLFNLVYGLILYPQICESVKNEYSSRNIDAQSSFSKELAIALPILTVCSIIPFLGILSGFASIVIFIVFWVKMAEYKKFLRANK
jgi:hypothetical protein